MNRFASQYTELYAALGSPLRPGHGLSVNTVSAGERKLGIQLPPALRDYYLVAGRERRFNHAHDSLMPPREWFIDVGQLAFMEGHQAVVFWGISAQQTPGVDDPPVFQGVNVDEIDWYAEHDCCSVFLRVMLVWNGTFGGGMQHSNTAVVAGSPRNHLDQHWVHVGEVNDLRAYHRTDQAVCLVPWEDGLRVMAGATTRGGLDAIAKELGAKWDGFGLYD